MDQRTLQTSRPEIRESRNLQLDTREYNFNYINMPDTKQESPMAVVTAVPVMEMTRENVPAPGTAQWKNGVCGCCDHKGTNGEEAIEFLH